MLKQQQTLQQTLKLSPQQIQLIRMLEMPVLELEERVRQELEDNPTLEEGSDIAASESQIDTDENDAYESSEEIDLGDYRSEDDIPDYKLQSSSREMEERQPEYNYTRTSSFHEQLIEQLELKELPEATLESARYLIGNIDNNGYLTRPLSAIADDLAFATGIDIPVSIFEEALSVIQELDPAGVGASCLQECLLLQLERKRGTHISQLAYQIVDKEFDAFTKKHYDKLQKAFGCNEEELREAFQEILSLNPKPGNAYSDIFDDKMEQIVPDFIVENIDGELVLTLNNGNIPELHVNNAYVDMFQDWNSNKANRKADVRNAVTFAKQKLDAAKWFIEAIQQRNVTMTLTMKVILELQKEFFLTGDETRLRPMILRDVAERTGYDISTISRVSNSKYVLTDFGVFPLRFFFSEASQTTEGEEISTREVKKILAECIANEDKKKPLSDDKLSEMLQQRGYSVARRTVAKYREQQGIPVARLRKEI